MNMNENLRYAPAERLARHKARIAAAHPETKIVTMEITRQEVAELGLSEEMKFTLNAIYEFEDKVVLVLLHSVKKNHR